MFDTCHGCHVNCRREGVICGLGTVDMVIGVDRPVAAKRLTGSLSCQVADHLIDVHVRLGAAAGLPDAQGELIIMLTVCNR